MEKIQLAVLGETSYAERLAECMKKNAPEYLEILKYNDADLLFSAQMQPDILLYEKEIKLTVEDKVPKNIVKIRISNSRKTNTEGDLVIFRYQKASEIRRQIFQIYEQKAKNSLTCWCRNNSLKMTAVYAPGGHELQFPFSMVYAALVGEKSRVLYLNLAEFTGMNQLLEEENGENFSDLIYGIRHRKEKFLLCLESVLHHAEMFDYVQPPENPGDFCEIKEEDLTCLLSMLQDQTEYDLIVWNCGSWNPLSEKVMEYCDRILCVVRENTFGKYRKLAYEQFLSRCQGKKFQKKTEYINLQSGISGFVPGVDVFTQLVSGEFMDQVRKRMQNEQQESEG